MNQLSINKKFEKPELSLTEYLFILKRGYKTILATLFLVLLGTIYYTFSENPLYQASSTILIDRPERMDAMFGMGSSGELSDITNVVELIKSRRLAIGVVEKLWNSDDRNNLEIFGTKSYIHRGQRFRRFFKEVVSLGEYEPKDDSPHIFNEGYTPQIGAKFSGEIFKRINVSSKRKTDILVITCSSSFPYEAALIANAVTDVFKKLDNEWQSEESYNMKNFLISQIAVKESELTAAENILRKYQEEEQVFSIEANAQNVLNKTIAVESEFNEIKAELNIKNEQKIYILSRLSEEEKILAEQLKSSINIRLLALRTELGNLETELVRNSGIYSKDHEVIKSLHHKIKQMKDKLDIETSNLLSQGLSTVDPISYREELVTQLVTLEAEISIIYSREIEFSKLVQYYKKELNSLPQKQLEYARLERDRSVLAEVYSYMRTKLEETRISVASEAGTIRIIDKAIKPTFRVSPNHLKNILIGIIIGIMLGVGFLFSKEYFDDTIRSVDYIERMGLILLGVIPEVGQAYIRKTTNRTSENRLSNLKNLIGDPIRRANVNLQRRMVTREDPKSPISEAYRMLRTNILYSSTDSNIQTILVSSPGPGEGKSTTVTNLAITFANLGKKTLLVDVDLRKPVVHRIFEINREPGMTNYLSGNIEDFSKLIHKTEVENLHIVSAGISPPNPSELLASKRMSKVIKELKEEWDVILFDTPPISAVTDAISLSQMSDSLVLVVKAGQTHKDALYRVLTAIDRLTTPLTGVVLNGVSKINTYDSYYYYYQPNYQYYGNDSDENID